MRLLEIGRGEDWMTPVERKTARTFVAQLRGFFKRHGVPENPLLSLRVNDLLVSYLMARRLEEQLAPGVLAENEDKKGAPGLASVAEAAGKARDRMRKAMKELEESCAKLGAPIDTGLADRLAPIIKKAVGVVAASTELSGDGED